MTMSIIKTILSVATAFLSANAAEPVLKPQSQVGDLLLGLIRLHKTLEQSSQGVTVILGE